MAEIPSVLSRLCTARAALALAAALVLPAPAAWADGPAASKQHQWVGAKKCKTCHRKDPIGNQYDVWLKSKHAKAFETLAGEKAKKWAVEASVADPQTDEKCFKCHVSAHGVADELLAVGFDRTAQGVQCEACHGAGKDYRKKKTMIDRDLALSKGLVPQSEKVCVTCHNDESPAWDSARYTRADGTKVGFDYEQAVKKIAHPVPEGYDPLAEGEAD